MTTVGGANQRRPRVALVGPRVDSRGGIATTIRTLAESDLADRYDLVTVATYRDAAKPGKALQAAGGFARLTWLLVRRDVDLVHVHSASGASLVRKLIAVLITRAGRRPLVVQIHGGSFGYKLRRSGWRGRFVRTALRVVLEQADAVIALTPTWGQELGKWARIRRLYVVPSAPDRLPPVQGDGSHPADGRTLLFLGHLHTTKGVFELLDAFARLRMNHPDLRLVLAGAGTQSLAIGEHARAIGLAPGALELPGWVGPEAKVHFFASASCFVLPSYHEGLPLALLEAMSAGLPVVATAVGGVPDVVRHEVEGLLVPPRDADALAAALARVLEEPDLAARLGHAASRRALQEYSAEALSRRIGIIYDEVLNRR